MTSARPQKSLRRCEICNRVLGEDTRGRRCVDHATQFVLFARDVVRKPRRRLQGGGG